ncbi:hypothetical protein OPT61_g10195 [Boeremia exigua]|uniref:Uncharacterized protein n=1 Tax=Boeremia exigua TaxID=749465 RepID=A0ACC2HQT1_9PLEO|nr:hypothetical protein OPT61_g10195 [Boeremia exigua]
MLLREDSVAVKMSVQSNLQRPRSASWKIEAIRRGDLKISGPIPIEEDTPLSDEEERKYAEKHTEKRAEDTLDVPAQHTIRQVPNSQGTLRPEDGAQEVTKTQSQDQDFARQELELHDQHPARAPLRSPLGMHPTDSSSVGQRESVVQQRSHTPTTALRATPESTSQYSATMNAKRQKRKSGIRGVLRKMFGRKEREESQERSLERAEERAEEPVRRGHSYHHSDPGMLQKSQTVPSPPLPPQTPNAQRISDLTVKELQPPHPLINLPYPMNVNAPPASPPHEYLKFDFQRTDLGARRATLPNLPGEVAMRHSLDESRGRLSTWDEKPEEEPLPSTDIGIALSGPSHAVRGSMGDRRRSRSAGALRELAKARFSTEEPQTRTDVIKSWRDSYASASMYSQSSRPPTARTVETVRSVNTKGPTVHESESIHEGMSATLIESDDLTPGEPTPRAQEPSTPEPAPRAHDWETPEHPPVSAFNFGDLEPSSPHEHPATLAQLEGPPVPSRSPKRLSVEDRLFESTTSISTSNSRPSSGTATPTASTVPGSVFSPGSRSSGVRTPNSLPPGVSDEYRTLIQRAFVPHVAVLADAETEALVKSKGLDGGFLELLRPFGEQVPGKVTIRDSIGASKSHDDFGVRFVGVEDAYPDLRGGQRASTESTRRPRRTGGDVSQIEEVVDRHLQYSEHNHQDPNADYMNKGERPMEGAGSPFHTLYLRRLLSGIPIVPHETFAHPVAGIIAISSSNPHPIEELRRLYNRQHDGDLRFPQWVENDFLRYYVLVHDEENGDIAKSNQTFDSMKRHFGLHCHLLRLKSQECIPSDDDSVRLPTCEWMSAGEELAEIQKRETTDDITDPTPYFPDSDISSLRTFILPLRGTNKSYPVAVASQAASCLCPSDGHPLETLETAHPLRLLQTPITTAYKASTALMHPKPSCDD